MDHQYSPRGKTRGDLQNIPNAQCRICGDSISQPLPTGLWTHGGRSDNDYTESSLYGHDDHVPIPCTLIDSLLILNKREDRDYGEGQCQLHRKYWLELAKLKKKEVERMIGGCTASDWHYWKWQNKRFNSLATEKYTKKKKSEHRKQNFKLPKLMIYGEFRNEVISEFEIGMTSDWVQEYFGLSDKFVYVGKKMYVIRGDPHMQKKTPSITEWRFGFKALGKYDKERLEKYQDEEIPQFIDLFKKYIDFKNGIPYPEKK